MGSQGSGKGTQATKLAHEFNLFNLDAGRFLRELAKTRPQLNEIINTRGLLLPDEEIFQLITDDLNAHGIYDNLLLDGYPRSVKQYELFEQWLAKHDKSVTTALFLNISHDEAIRRLSARRVHKITGEVYNLVTNPPPADVKMEDLEQREDDTPESIKQRLTKYYEVTGPLIEHLRSIGKLIEVNGEQPIVAIHDQLIEKLRKIQNEGH